MIDADSLNAAVQAVHGLARVRFDCGLGPDAENWLKKKHAGGAVHEPGTLGAFLACREKLNCRTIWDVGALYGYFTLFAAMAWGEDAELTAFEMHPAVCGPLRANVGYWANTVNAAVSDKCSENERIWVSGFNIYEEPEGGWGNLPSIHGAMKERGENNRGRFWAKVNFITLDAYRTDKPPDLIKIDVEGYQAKAILGAINTISYYRPTIIIELHDPEKIARFNTTNALTVKPLFDIGYRGFWCGNFRDADARFEPVTAMGEQHERLSLMVFTP